MLKVFVEYADEIVKGAESLYMAEAQKINEPKDVKQAPYIKKTFYQHKIFLDFNKDNVCKLYSFFI